MEHLGQLGYRTLSANSGEEALNVLADSKNIDLLFSDIVMHGGMDGYELAKKALKQRPGLKVLMASGLTTKDDEVLFKRLSPSSRLIRKPYTRADVARNIQQILNA